MQLPDKFVMSAINFESMEFNAKRSESRGGRILVSGTPGHRFAFTIQTPPLRVADELQDLSAFLDEVGSNRPFTVQLPVYTTSRGVWGASPTVSASASTGSKSISITGLTASQNDSVMGFDFIKFANHTKVYSIANNQTGGTIQGYPSNGSGNAKVNLSKYLLEPVTIGTAIDYQPAFTVIADADAWKTQINASRGLYAQLELPVVEYF